MGVILFRLSRKRSGSNNGSEESGSTHALSKSETELFITPHHSQNPLECLVSLHSEGDNISPYF